MLLQLTVRTGSYREIKNGIQKGLKNQKIYNMQRVYKERNDKIYIQFEINKELEHKQLPKVKKKYWKIKIGK